VTRARASRGVRFARALAGRTWEHEGAPHAAVDHRFRIRTNVADLGVWLEDLLASTGAAGDAEIETYTFVDRGRRAARFVVLRDDRVVVRCASAATALSHLFWDVNRRVVERSGRYVLLHASCVERDGHAVVMPAPPDSGKTTLAVGLVAAGWRYVTDEAVAVDPDTLAIVPWPKQLALDPGSWPLFPHLRPEVPDALAAYVGDQWHVPTRLIRDGDVVSTGCHAAFVVAPRYVHGSPTELTPMARADAVMLLAENCFNLRHHGGPGLATLAALVRSAECHSLRNSALDEAVAAVEGLVLRAPGSASPPR